MLGAVDAAEALERSRVGAMQVAGELQGDCRVEIRDACELRPDAPSGLHAREDAQEVAGGLRRVDIMAHDAQVAHFDEAEGQGLDARVSAVHRGQPPAHPVGGRV